MYRPLSTAEFSIYPNYIPSVIIGTWEYLQLPATLPTIYYPLQDQALSDH